MRAFTPCTTPKESSLPVRLMWSISKYLNAAVSTVLKKIAALCEEAGIPCFLGGCIETTPGTAAQAHFYCATQNIISAAEMEGPWCYVDDVVRDPLELEKGMVKIPDDPGLGVIIDEEKVARYRIDF